MYYPFPYIISWRFDGPEKKLGVGGQIHLHGDDGVSFDTLPKSEDEAETEAEIANDNEYHPLIVRVISDLKHLGFKPIKILETERNDVPAITRSYELIELPK